MKQETVITIPNNLLEDVESKSRQLTPALQEFKSTQKQYTLSELLALKFSLTEKVLKVGQQTPVKHCTLKELEGNLTKLDAINYNLVLVKEMLGVGNGALYTEIFNKSALEAKKITLKRVISINKLKADYAVRTKAELILEEIGKEIKVLVGIIERYNNNVKVNLTLLTID